MALINGNKVVGEKKERQKGGKKGLLEISGVVDMRGGADGAG